MDNKYDSNSNKTIILWENDENLMINNTINKDTRYKIPQGLSENYSSMITQTAIDLVNSVIEDSQWIVQNSHFANRSSFAVNSDDENESSNDNFIKSYKDLILMLPSSKLLMSDSNNSLLSKSEWLSEDEMLDDYIATMKISEFIKNNWDLDKKYLYTVEKIDTSIVCGSACYSYKVEFSLPIVENPIPLITVSAFFIIEMRSVQSLPVYVKYRLETDVRVYVVGRDAFNKNRFEHLFVMKRDAYADINRYLEWSSGLNRSRRF